MSLGQLALPSGTSASSAPAIVAHPFRPVAHGSIVTRHGGLERATTAAASVRMLSRTPAPAGPGATSSMKAPSASAGRGRASAGGLAAGASGALTPAAPTLLNGFAGTSQDGAIARFGTDQAVAPPDPNIAVGPNDVIEAANSTLSFFRRDGTLESSLDIGAFIGTPCGAHSVTDPRVVYDPSSGRFYFTVLSFDYPATTNNCVVLLASPTAGVATGTWNGYILSSTATVSGVPEADQPGLGFSDAVVAVTWNYFASNGGAFAGSQLDIIQKSDLISNRLANNTTDVVTGGPPSPQPVVSIGATGGHQFVVFNDSDKTCGNDGNPQSIGVYDFTGQPEQGTVAFSVAHPGVATATAGCAGTVPAPQLGMTATLSTDDDRLPNAVWENNVIWTGGGTDCTPSGDTAPRSCLNLDSISTANGVVATATQLIVGVVGAYLFYPAISVDRSGNAYVVFDESTAASEEAIMVAGIVGGALSPSTALHTSSTWYDPAGAACSPDCRWGDYSGAAQDPGHPNDVWVVSEDTDGNTTPNCGNSSHVCWNTFIGRYTYPMAPSISGLAAPTGPISGGRKVTVNGSDFLPGTTATFGGAPIPINPGTLSPDSFQVTTPPGSVGSPQAVQATDTAGTSAPTRADQYVYGDSFSLSGRSDVAAVNSTSAYVMASSGSRFAAPGAWASGAFFGSVATLAGDLNHDGMTDLVAVNSNNVWVERSTGHSFSSPVAWSSGIPFFGSKATLLADVNGDGRADLIAVNADNVWVMLSTGSRFSAPVRWSSNAPFSGGISTMAGDVTGNGRAALVAVNTTNTLVMTSSGTAFNPPTVWSKVPFFGSRATILGDVSGDGKADLLAVNNTTTFVMTSTGAAFNNSPAQWSSVAFYGSRATLLGDLHGNGREDLIAVDDASTWVMSSTATRFAGPVQWSATPFYGNVATVSGG
jgi:FG-GAP-like repeat/IPT/TIG domain